MPSACTIARFSTPARMISPIRVNLSSASNPTNSTAAAAISRNLSFGIAAPPMSVVSVVHAGRANGRGSAPRFR